MSRDRRHARPLLAVLLALAVATAGAAWGHATLVFGAVSVEPAPPPTSAPFELTLRLRDPTQTPVEDATVLVEATPPDGASPEVRTDPFEEVSAGRYRTTLTLDTPGAWTLRFRDRTFPQEEATAALTLEVGPEGTREEVSFIFPPTDTGSRNLTTWLAWLIGLPLVAGAVVSVLVLRRGAGEEGDEA